MDQTQPLPVSKKFNIALLLMVTLLLYAGCGFPQATSPLRIALSKASPNYEKWLERSDPTIQTVNLYLMPVDSALRQLALCHGLLLTGGEDVYPGWYGKEKDTLRCTEMNPHRDSLDLALIARALEMKMPVFAVCRGHQILNVCLQGTLFVDIPQDVGKQVTHQCEDYTRCFHEVKVVKSSLLASISGCSAAMVTTNHHQAIDHLAPALTANAFSGDHLAEGIEWKQPSGKSFYWGSSGIRNGWKK